MALTKAEMAAQLQEHLGISLVDCKCLVDDFIEAMIETLESGQEMKLSGFGTFKLLDKHARPGRNPKTREEVPIKARRVVTFRAGPKLRARTHHGNDAE